MSKKRFITESDKLGITQYKKRWLTNLLNLTHTSANELSNIYSYNDLIILQGLKQQSPGMSLETLEKLLERDKQREKDGFQKKIKIDRIPATKGKFIIIPTTEESKLLHGMFEPQNGKGQSTGDQGGGQEGDIIGEEPIENQPGDDEENGAGEGDSEEHGISADAYEYGKQLVEKFNLPNLKNKGKKVALHKYIYDLTDKRKESGQILDIEATMSEIIKTNLALGKIPDINNIDPSKLIVSPEDSVFRILSREIVYEEQALVFFGRDYSGSMDGEPTKAIVTQHLMLYSWLMYQYGKRVTTRFIVHDTEAKEAPNFETYYKSITRGGTKISSVFSLINKIVAEENLFRDYNIYVFYGTDGDNFEEDNEKMIQEIKKTLMVANRTGVTVARNGWGFSSGETLAEKQIKQSNILDIRKFFRMFALNAKDFTEEKNIEAIKFLISE